MTKPVVIGAGYSVYVRIVQLALEEKGVDYDHEPIDIFDRDGLPLDYLAIHPFGKIPAFNCHGRSIIETSAIVRYIDAAFDGPSLTPADILDRARVDQIISILDAYAYQSMVWNVFVESVEIPKRGQPADQNKIASGLSTAARCMGAVNRIRDVDEFMVGDQISLADLYAAPIIDRFVATEPGRDMINSDSRWHDWWQAMAERPSYRQVITAQADD